MVCMGNICRSPMAEAVLRAQLDDAGLSHVHVDSAGIGAWHVGERADRRARAETERNGITITSRARQISTADFFDFDLILTADHEVHTDTLRIAPSGHDATIALLRSFDEHADDLEVPDPYYGGPDDFARVYAMVDSACRGVVAHLQR